MTAPSTMANAPPAPRIPCEVNFASRTNSASASTSSAAPSQLIGNTEMRGKPSSARMAPATPGKMKPGCENST